MPKTTSTSHNTLDSHRWFATARPSLATGGTPGGALGVPHGDDDLASGASFFQITDRLGDLAQRERSVDHRRKLARFEELPQEGHRVFLVWHREVRGRQLAHERGEDNQFEDAGEASQPAARPLPEAIVPDEHVLPTGGEDAPAIRERTVTWDIEDQIVALTASGVILLGVVEEAVRAQRSDHLQFPRAIHAGDPCSMRFRDLHGEGAHATA